MIVHPLSTGFGLSFLLEDARGLYLIDSGSPRQHNVVLRKMRALGRSDLKLIWITHAHFDHYGSASALRALTGAPVGAHPADTESMARGLSPLGSYRGRGPVLRYAQLALIRLYPLTPTQVDFQREDGQTLEQYGLEATILHTPGHTPGHTCVLVTSDKGLTGGLAFAGDLVARNPRPRLQDLLATDWGQLPASLKRLQAARPSHTFTGHSTRPMSWEMLERIG